MLKIFGVPLSQPCRAVIWVCLYKGLPFEIVLVNPGSKSAKGSRHPNFLAMNPQGTIPTIKDDDGHVLWESNAILTYLAQKHGWTDLYPADLRRRSLVDQYLHWHHRNAREASLRLAAPNFRKGPAPRPPLAAALRSTRGASGGRTRQTPRLHCSHFALSPPHSRYQVSTRLPGAGEGDRAARAARFRRDAFAQRFRLRPHPFARRLCRVHGG